MARSADLLRIDGLPESCTTLWYELVVTESYREWKHEGLSPGHDQWLAVHECDIIGTFFPQTSHSVLQIMTYLTVGKGDEEPSPGADGGTPHSGRPAGLAIRLFSHFSSGWALSLKYSSLMSNFLRSFFSPSSSSLFT